MRRRRQLFARGSGRKSPAPSFPGRAGLPADRYYVWMANLGPSERLLKWFLAGKITGNQFGIKCRAEMFAPAATDAGNAMFKNHGQKFTLRLIAKLAEK